MSISTGPVDWLDRLALGASAACLLHCLALPLLVAALPALATVLAVSESFHVGVLLFALPTAAVALLAGRRRHHARWPLPLGIAGLALLAAGLVFPRQETLLTVAGSLALAAAHLANWRLRHRALTSPPRPL